MKVIKTSKKLVKPLTPTPQHLKNYKISFADKRQWPTNLCVVLFYESKPPNDTQLEESLAKTLVQFYPLAGRYIKNDLLIDCNDDGVDFVEAEAPNDVVLMDVIAKADFQQLNHLLPDQHFRADEGPHDPLLSIQTTRFPCGGLTVAISVSHRVFDTSSLGTFIAAWSSASCKPDGGAIITPTFHLPSLLPCKDSDLGGGVDSTKNNNNYKNNKNYNNAGNNIVVKRLVFTKEGISRLKSKANLQNGKRISNVRIVCAVIVKGLIAIDAAKHGRNRDLIIFQPVNMRERTIPPQPKHTCGNFSFTSVTRRAVAPDIGVEEMAALIGGAARKTIADFAEIASPNRDGRDIIIQNLEKTRKEFSEGDSNAVFLTDRSGFGFYDADFGFGKPVWITGCALKPVSNTALLMSNREGDGIEAWLHLNQNDLPYFNQEEDLKLFAV